MADIPQKHRSFTGHDVLRGWERGNFFYGPVELKEWPENTDPLFEGELDKHEFFNEDSYIMTCEEMSHTIGLQQQSNNGHLSTTRGRIGDSRGQKLWQNTLWGLKFDSSGLIQESGDLNRCYFGDVNGDGKNDIVYQIKKIEGDKEVYKNVALYSSDWDRFMWGGGATRKTYENLFKKILEYFLIRIGFEREPFAPPAVLKAIGLFIKSMESLEMSERSENLVVTDVASIIRRLAMRWRENARKKNVQIKEMTGEVLRVIYSLRMVMEQVARHENAEEIAELVFDIVEIVLSYSNRDKDISRLSDLEIVSAFLNLTEHIKDARRLKQSLAMLKFIISGEGVSRRDYKTAAYLLYKLSRALSGEEFSLVYGEMRKKFNIVSSVATSEIINGLEDIVFNSRPEDYFAKTYEWLTEDDSSEIDRSLLAKYNFAFDTMFPPPYEDIKYADEELGVEKARLLYEKFNIVHFKRYSKSILDHLAKMAGDASYMRDNPLLLALVAKSDPPGMFYWGQTFEYNDEIRVVAIEVGSKEEFVYYNRWVKENYGVPNAVFMTAHGTPREILLGESGYEDTMGTKDEDWIKKEIDAIYGNDRPKLVVINACSTGGDVVDKDGNTTKDNFAQAAANIYQAPTLAARAREALPKLDVEVKDGNIQIYPYFVEMGAHMWQLWDVRFNFGGTRFEPKEKEFKRTYIRRDRRNRNRAK